MLMKEILTDEKLDYLGDIFQGYNELRKRAGLQQWPFRYFVLDNLKEFKGDRKEVLRRVEFKTARYGDKLSV